MHVDINCDGKDLGRNYQHQKAHGGNYEIDNVLIHYSQTPYEYNNPSKEQSLTLEHETTQKNIMLSPTVFLRNSTRLRNIHSEHILWYQNLNMDALPCLLCAYFTN